MRKKYIKRKTDDGKCVTVIHLNVKRSEVEMINYST